jgi:hypothetical protein
MRNAGEPGEIRQKTFILNGSCRHAENFDHHARKPNDRERPSMT